MALQIRPIRRFLPFLFLGAAAVAAVAAAVHPATERCRMPAILLAAAAMALLAARRRSQWERAVSEHYAGLSSCAHDSVILFDQDMRVVEANDRALACYGYTREEMLGFTAGELLAAEPPPTIEEMLRKVEQEGGAVFENLHRRRDGTFFPVEISMRSLCTRGRTFYQTIGRDITARKRAGVELERALAQAREATELKSQFLANMSHEIRTPIHGVLGMTELLLCTRLDSEQREYADAVRRSAQALLAVINDILDLSKIEAGKLELEHIVFDLWSTVEEVAALMAFRAYGKKLELTCLIWPNVPRLVRGDPARIRQVLTNLAGNAVKFTEEGEVSVMVEVVGEGEGTVLLQFSVADTGIGIPPEQREHLFDSFVQGDCSTTRRYGGSGLGLAISRHLVERMGGRIDLESQPGQGSTFRFTAALVKESGQPAAVAPEVFAGLRVLVVDDKAASRRVVERYLQSWGCRTEEAARGDEALLAMVEASHRGDPFRVALIDLQMPERDGSWLAEAVRSEPGVQNTALVALAPLGMAGETRRIEGSGFAACLAKPVRPSQLYGSLLEVLSPGSTERPPELPSKTVPEVRAGRSVLLAEDNEINQLIVLRLLERVGCRATRVANGREAVAAVATGSWDLVLMDVQMPEMDGFEATAEIRRQEAGVRHTPIAAMTANAMTGDREKCLSAGMDDYIAKPVRLEDLNRMLSRWLQ
ncbi:MAG TPA: response regulator [Bryobacteraceae bacterium]|nr:response regulator [Bryobacteraceae bacterium]